MKKPSVYFLIGKIVILQTFFYYTAKYGPLGHGPFFFITGLCLMMLNFYLVKHLINFRPYITLMCIFFATGFVQDTILIALNMIDLGQTYPPIWIPTLWMIFIGYYGDVFNKMMDFPLWLMALLGSAGGTLAYYRGLSQLTVSLHDFFYPTVAIVWAIFMPFTLKYFRYYRDQKINAGPIHREK